MTSTISANPFPGLRPFRTDEDYLFFGREGQSEEILRRLRLNRFVSVVGTSGSGKSSLIRAGLLPYLFGGFMSGAGSHWRVAVFRPGSDPMGNLVQALNDPAVIGDPGDDEEAAKRRAVLLEVALRRSGLGLIEAVRASSLAKHDNLLIVVDQFEELFRFAGAARSQRKEEDAAAFVKLLLEAAGQSELPVYVVITMRSDFIGDCARFRDLPEAVTAGLYLIPRMTREQRRAAIEGPARVGSAEMSRRLINRLLNDGGDDPDLLPSLQHALMRTWVYWEENDQDQKPIDLEDYLAVGGIAGALSRHAEEAFAELPDERSREIAKRLFQSLTEKGTDNREVRRPTKLGDIAAMADAQTYEVIAVIEYFRREGRSFLTPPLDVPLDSESVIDISHESLIRGWDRLKTWVEEEYESAKMYRRLAETATLYAEGNAALWSDPDLSNGLRWRALEKPTAAWAKCYNPGFEAAMEFLEKSRQARDEAAAERERNRKRRLRNVRWFAATVTALFVIAAATAVYAIREQGRAVENARLAQTQSDKAQLASIKAETNRKLAEANQMTAEVNQNMALGFASSTVRGLAELSDFVLSQREVQDHFESLINEAGTVHGSVLKSDKSNFQALVMRINAQTAMAKLHVLSGRLDEAKKECAELEDEAAKLEKTNTDDTTQLLSAYLLARVAYTRTVFNDHEHALADVRHAVRVADKACLDVDRKHTPLEQQVLRCVRIVYSTSGYEEDQHGDSKAAIENYRKAVNILAKQEKVAAATPNQQHLDDRLRYFLLSDMRALATLETKANQKEASATTYDNAIQFARGWGNKDASITDNLFWLFIERGDSKKETKRYAEANEDYQAAARLAKSLNPNTTDAQFDSACAEERIGTLEHYRADIEPDAARKQQQLESAKNHHETALKKVQAMEKARGKNPGVEHNVGIEESLLAWDLAALQKPGESRASYQGSLDAHKLAADVDRNDGYFMATARAYRVLAQLDQQAKAWNGTIENYRNAIEFEKRVEQLDENTKQLLLSDFAQLADAKVQRDLKGDLDAALVTYNEGVAAGERWTKDSTPSPALIKDVIALYFGRGDAWLSKAEYEKARADYDAAGRQAGHLSATSTDGKFALSQVSEHLGKAWTNQATAEKDRTRQHEFLLHAKSCYEDTLQLRHQVLAAGESADAHHNLGLAEGNLGWTLYYLKDWDGARARFTASANTYGEATRLRPTDQERSDLERAYVLIALIDVERGGDQLSSGNGTEARAAFQSAREAAARPSFARADGRRVRSVIEESIAKHWRDKGLAEEDKSRRAEYLRLALEGDENALRLRREIAAGKKDPEGEENVAKAEKDVGSDYANLGDEENARRHYDASSQAFLAAKPGTDTIRTVAGTYSDLAILEIQLGNRRAARDAYDKEIDLLKPLLEDLKATAEDKKHLASAFGNRSWENAMLGDPWAALSDADQGLVLDSQQNFIRLNKADAYLLLGQVDKAREIYLPATDDAKCKGCRDSILEDLAEIQSHPELKVDLKALIKLQEELKRTKPQQGAASQSSSLK